MDKLKINDWFTKPKISLVLKSFALPKTPKQVERELDITKLKIKPFLKRNLLKSLNPNARKGRYYVLTCKAKRLLKIEACQHANKDWDLLGWILCSPKQRAVVLKSMDRAKRTSENIRERASNLNPHLSRISTKGILKELLSKGLVETELKEGKRYYWVTHKGKSTIPHLHLFNYQEHSS